MGRPSPDYELFCNVLVRIMIDWFVFEILPSMVGSSPLLRWNTKLLPEVSMLVTNPCKHAHTPTHIHAYVESPSTDDLKHKDSFGKSENLSKIFFAEILVFDHDYEGKSSSGNGLL